MIIVSADIYEPFSIISKHFSIKKFYSFAFISIKKSNYKLLRVEVISIVYFMSRIKN
jgi:hypothetical protein